MEEKKSLKISLGTVICMFIILILIIALVVVYYLGFIINNKRISKDISIVDAVNYIDGYYGLVNVKIPKIIGDTDTIERLNLKILNEVLPLTYNDVAWYAESKDTEYVNMDKGAIYNYTYVIENNILVIYVYSTIPEGGKGIDSTGDGTQHHTYCYDITNDKILTMEEAASKLKLSLDGIPENEEDSEVTYEELEENSYIMIIDGNELKLEFML